MTDLSNVSFSEKKTLAPFSERRWPSRSSTTRIDRFADHLSRFSSPTPAFRVVGGNRTGANGDADYSSLLNASAAVFTEVSSTDLREGDLVSVEAGQVIPGDGEIVAGIASVDESAITGESAPVVREGGGDRSGVTGGTRVLSDRIVVRITAAAGKSATYFCIAGVVQASGRVAT